VLERQPRHTPESVDGVAIAVAMTQFGTHAGMIYDDPPRGKKLLHVRFHYDLKAERVPEPVAWCRINLVREIAAIVASVCRGVAIRYSERGLPYAIRFLSSFDETGSIIDGDTGRGFTCSTMVLACFKGANIMLVDVSDWWSRDGDTEQQRRVIDALRHIKADTAHIEQQERDLGCMRFRPEDVLAAGILIDSAPNGLSVLGDLSDRLHAEISALPLYTPN
jgi:hypothetical protein